MNQREIRVGIVGADAKASWAKVSHVLAIKALPGVRLAAVATRSERSAREAAEAFGADRWYSDPFAMIRDERIDIVTIAVKVPAPPIRWTWMVSFSTSCIHGLRPEGANHQWRKIPPRDLSIDLVADERLGRVTGRAGAS
jgi:hypothetical protein